MRSIHHTKASTFDNQPSILGDQINILVNKYLFLGLCTAGLTVFSYYSIRSEIDWLYIVFILLSTSILYNYHNLLDLPTKSILKKMVHNPVLLIGVVSCFALFIVSVSLQYYWLIFLAVVIVMGYYSVGIFSGYTLRKNWLKPLSIGIVYALITITYPAFSKHIDTSIIVALTIERIIFIASLALIFDVGDFEKDKDDFPLTVPGLIGIRTSVIVAIIGIILAWIINLYVYTYGWINAVNYYSLSITYLLATLLFLKASPNKSKIAFYLVCIDGMIGLPFLIFLLAQAGQWLSFEFLLT